MANYRCCVLLPRIPNWLGFIFHRAEFSSMPRLTLIMSVPDIKSDACDGGAGDTVSFHSALACSSLLTLCNPYRASKSQEIFMFVSKKMPTNPLMPQSSIVLIVNDWQFKPSISLALSQFVASQQCLGLFTMFTCVLFVGMLL